MIAGNVDFVGGGFGVTAIAGLQLVESGFGQDDIAEGGDARGESRGVSGDGLVEVNPTGVSVTTVVLSEVIKFPLLSSRSTTMAGARDHRGAGFGHAV